MLRRLKRFVNRYIRDKEQETSEKAVLALLAHGKGREARAYERVAEAFEQVARAEGDDGLRDEEIERKAREAALETIRLTRMVNGVADLYSYGRGRDDG